MSLILRHDPGTYGVVRDGNGWTTVAGLLDAMADHGTQITRADLELIVASSDKQRFAISADGTLIRANQGHSVQVELDLTPQAPPDLLYHGTASRFLDSISRDGLKKMQRHHVHLHEDRMLATEVGGRHGKPVLLVVSSLEMFESGHTFFVTENKVWLTDSVPVEYIRFPDISG